MVPGMLNSLSGRCYKGPAYCPGLYPPGSMNVLICQQGVPDVSSLQMTDKVRWSSFPVKSVRSSALMDTSTGKPVLRPLYYSGNPRTEVKSTGPCDPCNDLGICL